MENTAKNKLIPVVPGILRCTFLYVGQGDCTLLTIPDGSSYKYALIDCNLDESAEGINVPMLLEDLLDDGLQHFINTHPHSDHLKGIEKIHEKTPIEEIWHSGHVPGKKNETQPYKEMMDVIKDIGDENEYFLFGTNDANTVRTDKEVDKDESKIVRPLGDIEYIILSPADFVVDEIDDEDGDTRYARIHEQCAVIKLMYGTEQKAILITGDSNKKAWQDRITDYHSDKLPSNVLRTSHHGSRSFFKENEDDEDVYEDHMGKIDADHVVISAPRQDESKYEHPHDDAMDIYEKHVNQDCIYHLGKKRHCVIVDIYPDGQIDVRLDSELWKEYKISDEPESTSNSGFGSIYPRRSTIDRKPSGR